MVCFAKRLSPNFFSHSTVHLRYSSRYDMLLPTSIQYKPTGSYSISPIFCSVKYLATSIVRSVPRFGKIVEV